MSSLTVFNFNENEVRIIDKEGAPWWVLADVCRVLGLSNPSAVASRLDDDETAKLDLGVNGPTIIINESGLYSVILRSDKPNAKPFRRWVTSEVLPQIRKTGGYQQSQLSPRLPSQVAALEIESRVKIGQLLGIDAGMSRVIAIKATEQATGLDLQAYQKLITVDHQEVGLTPTQLGEIHGLTPISMNRKLYEAGLQEKEGKQWMPTAKGKGYCTMNPYQSQSSGHTSYRVMWYERVLELIKEG